MIKLDLINIMQTKYKKEADEQQREDVIPKIKLRGEDVAFRETLVHIIKNRITQHIVVCENQYK